MIHTINGLIAPSEIFEKYNEAKQLKLQKATIEDLILVYATYIKEYMAENTLLYSPVNGAEIVTYKYDKDSEDLDKRMLKELFPEAYRACTVIRPGSRKFVLK